MIIIVCHRCENRTGNLSGYCDDCEMRRERDRQFEADMAKANAAFDEEHHE